MSSNPCTVVVDGESLSAKPGQPLIDLLTSRGFEVARLCYLPTLGAIGTCDTCWVEVDGELQRSCTLRMHDGLTVETGSALARGAREEGLDRVLAKHELYCTVCENNTGDCQLHNTVAAMNPPIQRYRFERKPCWWERTPPKTTRSSPRASNGPASSTGRSCWSWIPAATRWLNGPTCTSS